MTTPNRGRGHGNGRGRGRIPYYYNEVPTIPIIGYLGVSNVPMAIRPMYPARSGNMQQSAPAPRREELASSSSNTMISYKEIAITKNTQEQEYYENPITEFVMFIEDEDLKVTRNDAWSIKTRYLESRGYLSLNGQARPNLEILLKVTESVTVTHHYNNKVLLPREWGLRPNGDKAVKITEGLYAYYNYWDYIQTFWFFSINPEILEKPVLTSWRIIH